MAVPGGEICEVWAMKLRNICTLCAVALAGAAALLVGGCGGYSSSGKTYTGQVAAITIAPTASTIVVNGTQQYTATATDANGNTVSGVAYTWKSSNTSVATISGSGLATGVAAGTTLITASVTYGAGGPYGGMGTTITSNAATLNVTAMGTVMGTVAVGRAWPASLVTLEDARGHRLVTLTDRNGRYQLPVSGLAAPFLLRASDGAGGRTLFGFAAGEGVANIDPYTDLMARAWYRAQGLSMERAFADPAAHPAPDARALAGLNRALVDFLAGALASQGVDAARFNLISTPFTADSAGFDSVLDHTTIVRTASGLSVREALTGGRVDIAFAHGGVTFDRVSGTRGARQLIRVTLLPAARR